MVSSEGLNSVTDWTLIVVFAEMVRVDISPVHLRYDYYSPKGKYCKYSVGQNNGLHAFGYNSAESEPIWMKFGTL